MTSGLPTLLAPCLLAGLLAGCAAPGGKVATDRSTSTPAEAQIIVAVRNERPRMQRAAGSVSRTYAGAGHYHGSLQIRQRMAALARQYGLRPVAAWPIDLLDLYCVVFEVPEHHARARLLAEIARENGVVLAQPLQEFRTLASRPTQETAAVQAGMMAMGIPQAHEWATGQGVKVALVDTGVDSAHPGLAGRVFKILDFVGPKVMPAADEPHGLAVAGVIAAQANHELGMVGVAPQSGLLALRACWHTDPANAVCNSFTLARAISAAVELGADVINLSLTGPPDRLLERLLEAAIKRRVVVVGAVPDGESLHDEGPPARRFPTSVAGVIAVRSAESASGRDTGSVRAPGEYIFTLRPGGGHDVLNGSSLAAAHISGVAALLLELSSELGGEEVRALLSEHTRPVVREGKGNYEVVNACLAVAALVNGRCAAMAGQFVDLAPPSVSSFEAGQPPRQ